MIICYLRVSSEEQREHQSIQLQQIEMRAFCAQRQYRNVTTIEDDGVSGTIPLQDRPGGAQLVARLRSAKVERVLLWGADRLGRDIAVLVNAMEFIDKAGAILETKREGVLSLKDADKILTTCVQMGMAATERANISLRVKTRQLQLAAEGVWLTGRIPFGFSKVGMKKDSRLVLNEDEATVVNRIYKLASKALSCPKIAEQLNQQAQLDRGGIKWTADRIGNIIESPTYRGEHVYNKMARVIINGQRRQRTRPRSEWLSRPCIGIVTPALWDRANAEMHRNQIVAMAHATHNYLLRGLIRCECCGLNYVGTAVTGTDRFYYRCSASRRLRGAYGKQGKRCPSRSLQGKEVEELVLADIRNFVSRPGPVLAELRKALASRDEAQSVGAEIATMEKRLASRALARDRVLDLCQDGTISKAELNERLMRINTETASLEAQLAALRKRAQDSEADVRQLQSVGKVLQDVQKLLNGRPKFETLRRVVQALVTEIKVAPMPPEYETVGRGSGHPAFAQAVPPGTKTQRINWYAPGIQKLTVHYVFPTPAERVPLGQLGTGSTR